MSGKSRVRRTRRTNTHDEDHELKLDESIEQSDDNKSTKSNTTNETEKLEASLNEETNGHDTPTTENTKDTAATEASPKKPEEPIIDITEKTNGQPETTTSTSEAEKPETIKNGEDQSSSEIEPVSIDSEDPELQFPSEQNSDKSSEVESSPTLNRCRTRRSHTRNLPTPKTPKVPDLNGDTIEEESAEKCEDTPQTETPEIIITIPDEPEEISENVSFASNISIDGSIEEKTLDSDLGNASIFVNLGNDTTKNFDITVQSNLEEDSMSSFLETTKDKSYGETLRCLTGRKTSRNYHFQAPLRMYSSTIELHSKDLTDSSKKYAPLTAGGGGGVKRKLEGESPSDKRMRTEDVSPGILSYLTSPFKNKMARTEVPSSTPKLTSFKYVHHGSSGSSVINEVSKVDLDGDEKSTEPKKWCSIM